MRSFICKLVYWIMLKLYVFILWALLPLLTMGKGILIQNVVIFDGKSEKRPSREMYGSRTMRSGKYRPNRLLPEQK